MRLDLDSRTQRASSTFAGMTNANINVQDYANKIIYSYFRINNFLGTSYISTSKPTKYFVDLEMAG